MNTYEERSSIINKHGPHESQFEPYEIFPNISTKYKRSTLALPFEDSVGRTIDTLLARKANEAQIAIYPNKEFIMPSLNNIDVNMEKRISRRQRDKP